MNRLSDLLPAALLDLATARAPYALEVAGDALAPHVADGDLVAVRPCVGVSPLALVPGCLVLAAVASRADCPGCFDRPGVFVLTAERALQAGTATVPAERFIILGTVQKAEQAQAEPVAAAVCRSHKQEAMPRGWARGR